MAGSDWGSALSGTKGKYYFMFNNILVISASSWFVAQILKTLIHAVKNKKIACERMIGAGGMPSSHTAMVIAALVTTGRIDGVHSSVFGIAAVFSAVVIYDALNVRHAAGLHAKELNENKISYVDLSEVGEVVIEDWTYDEEEYQEWLVDNELQDTPENKMNYIEDFNVEFDVDLLDNQTYHTMCGDWVYYDDLVEKFGDNMAKKIESGMIENGSFKFDTSDIYADENYDINNPRELDDIAMKLLPHGEYFKGCRGFILSNGVVVYTEGEHNDVLRIPGINSKWQFIELGNIRLLPNSIDIGSEPTYEQEEVLEYMLRLYDGEEI